MTDKQLITNFSVEDKYGAFYTGGVVQMSKDGDYLFCQCGHTVKCLDVLSGKISSTIGSEEDDEVCSFTLSPDDEFLVVASRNLLLKQWNWKENVLTRTWKASHTGPISCMTFDATSTLLATGGADASIKVWDVIQQYCTHNLLGHSGVISVVAFHPDTERLQLVSAGDDYKVRVWCLRTSTCLAALEGHYSVVTGVQFSVDGNILYTAGRDNVVITWDAAKLTKLRTIPVYETVEALLLLPEGKTFPKLNVTSTEPHFVTGGNKGILRVWNATTSQCVYNAEEGEESEEVTAAGRSSITAAQLQTGLENITVVTHDHNICIHNLQDFAPKKHFVGYNDDVLDMQLIGAGDSHLVVATNSQLVKVFEVATWSCQVLYGHTDIVLCVAVKKDSGLFATGSKDNSLRLWQMETESPHTVCCVAVGNGHTHAVNAVSFARLQGNFLVSGSHDCTLKVWPLPEQFIPDSVLPLSSSFTEHAHEKEINSVTVTPNDKMIASGSQDKTAKLWSANNLSLLGVFRGHKRSIWCVQFSPVDQALATASADGTIKVWSLSDFSCVKTFEGHQSSVLRVNFVARGMQLVSSGSDGLLKLWTIKTNECVGTWDEHEEKVWALVVNTDESRLITGAGDSTICVWKDVTEEEQQESIRKQEEFILQEQQLSNLLQNKKYVKAIGLAITLNQPFRVLNILKDMLDGEKGREDATQTLQKLRDDQIGSLLGYCSKWNTNSKHCHVAQFVINTTLIRYSPEQLLKLPDIKTTVQSLLPYTERHFQRMNRLQQQSTFVEYTWQSMKYQSNIQSVLGEDEADVHQSAGTGLSRTLTEEVKLITPTGDQIENGTDTSPEEEESLKELSQPKKKRKTTLSDKSSEEESEDSSDEEDVEKPTKIPQNNKKLKAQKGVAAKKKAQQSQIRLQEEKQIKPPVSNNKENITAHLTKNKDKKNLKVTDTEGKKKQTEVTRKNNSRRNKRLAKKRSKEQPKSMQSSAKRRKASSK